MTELGRVVLGECIASIRAGTSYGGEARRPRSGEVGILTLSAVSGGRFDPDACKAVMKGPAVDLGGPVSAGTLLMSRSNTIDLVGSAVLVENDHPDRFLPDLLWEIRLREDSPLVPEFLVDFLGAPAGRRLLQSAAMGTSGSMKKLSMARLRSIAIPVPLPSVQRQWAGVRRVLGRVEATCEGLVASRRAFKRALMEDLLTGRRRFPEFAADPWPTRALGEVAAINPDFLGVTAIPDMQIRYIELSAVKGGKVAVPTTTTALRDAPSRARRMTRAGDLLMSTVRPYLQGFGMVTATGDDLVCSTGFAVVRPSNATDGRFLLEVLFSDATGRQTNALLTGSSYPALNESQVAGLAVPWPSAAERERIGSALWHARCEIDHLTVLSAHYERLKRGLMHRLLSGNFELPEALLGAAETAAAEAAS